MIMEKLPKRLPILEAAWDFNRLADFRYQDYKDQRTVASDRKMNIWVDNLKKFINDDNNPDHERGKLIDIWYGMLGYRVDNKSDQFKIDRFKRKQDQNAPRYGWYEKTTITPEKWEELKQTLNNEGGYRFINDPVTQGKINVDWSNDGINNVGAAAYYSEGENAGTLFYNYDPNFENL